MIPPEFAVPVPTTVKLPPVSISAIPFGPPLVETVVSDMFKAVLAGGPSISTAAALLVVMVPLVVVIEPDVATALVA